jgi:hypothetical protein
MNMNVKMKIYKNYLLTSIVMICFCLLLSACGVATSTDEGEAIQTPAEKYLQETSVEDIFDYFVMACNVGTGEFFGFASPEQISTDDLFRFAMMSGDTDESLARSKAWYSEPDKLYFIPVKDVTAILDCYFEGYKFVPEELHRWVNRYDKEKSQFETTALGFGTGAFSPSFHRAFPLNLDIIQVEIADMYSNGCIVTGKITDSGVKFMSCYLSPDKL